MQTNRVIKPAIRYSEAFKIKLVTELEREGMTVAAIRAKYGIKGGCTVEAWLRKYGNGTRGKIMRVETLEEINELKRLKEACRLAAEPTARARLPLAMSRVRLNP